MVKSLRARRAVVAATTAASLVAGASAPVQASAVQDAYYAHTKLCISLFFKDRDAHAEQCLPNNMPNIWEETGSRGAIAAPPPPPVVAPPPPPVVVVPPASSYPSVGSSHST